MKNIALVGNILNNNAQVPNNNFKIIKIPIGFDFEFFVLFYLVMGLHCCIINKPFYLFNSLNPMFLPCF